MIYRVKAKVQAYSTSMPDSLAPTTRQTLPRKEGAWLCLSNAIASFFYYGMQPHSSSEAKGQELRDLQSDYGK